MGVEALNKARCFLHSGRGKEVANKDVVSAKAVGAAGEFAAFSMRTCGFNCD